LGVGDGSSYFATGGSGFTGRLVILVEDVDLAVNTSFYESSSSGVTFLYLGSNKQITQLGGCSLFRGFIYNNSSKSGSGSESSFIVSADPPMKIQGSVYCTNTGTYRMEGGGPLTIEWDPTVISEMSDLGVFVDLSGNTDAGESELKVKEGKTIEASFLSRTF